MPILTETIVGTEWRALLALPSGVPEMKLLLPSCQTTEEFEIPRTVRYPGEEQGKSAYRWNEVTHPTSIHKAVHVLYTVMRRKEVRDESLVVATMVLHRAGFGLVVYKYPRPGVVHVFNKKFGEAPIALWEEPLPIEALKSAANQFV